MQSFVTWSLVGMGGLIVGLVSAMALWHPVDLAFSGAPLRVTLLVLGGGCVTGGLGTLISGTRKRSGRPGR